MSWNAVQILRSIKNSVWVRYDGQYFRWQTAEGREVSLKRVSYTDIDRFVVVREGAIVVFSDYVNVKEGEVETIERIVLKKLLR